MRLILLPVLLCCFVSTATFAAPASDEKVRELFDAMQLRNMLDDVRHQYSRNFSELIQLSLNGMEPTPRQSLVIDKMKGRMAAVMQAEMTWARMEPIYLSIYRDSFSDEEIAGMLAFYRSPAGKAVVARMPAVTQKMMAEMQTLTIGVQPKLQDIYTDFSKEMDAAK